MDDRKHDNPVRLDDERQPTNPAAGGVSAEATGARRISEQTSVHDAGSDANDTLDGLTESEEAVRRSAEDRPSGEKPPSESDAVPVFDRGGLPPKV